MKTILQKSDFFSELKKYQKRNDFDAVKIIPKNMEELNIELRIAFFNLKKRKISAYSKKYCIC